MKKKPSKIIRQLRKKLTKIELKRAFLDYEINTIKCKLKNEEEEV